MLPGSEPATPEAIPGQEFVFPLALVGEGIEREQDFIDEAGGGHDQTIIRQTVQKSLHQYGEVRLRQVIGAGEGRIEADAGARGMAAKSGA